MIKNKNFYTYLTFKYKYHGRIAPNLDCMGLIMYHYKEKLGINLPDYPFYPDNSKINKTNYAIIKIFNEWSTLFNRKLVEDIKENDIIAIKNGCTDANHLGIAISNKYFIHILENKNCNIQKISKWKSRISAIGRYFTYDN